MRKAPDVGFVNTVVSVPAPGGGLNAYDSLVAMPPTDAVILQNWWPTSYGCVVRKGYRKWASGIAGQVSTLASWASMTGPQKLFAWGDGKMFDISTSGPVGAPMVTGLLSDVWESVNFSNAAGTHLIALNGVDDGIRYSASGVVRIIAGDGIVPNTWAGIDPKNAVGPVVHQHRLWVVQRDSTAGWFLPPDAIQGTFIKYDFGPLFSRGGFLQFLATWTLDDGSGATDHLIAVSSRGEAVVYEGIDPEDDLNWKLTGVYFIGAPVSGRRQHVKAGGDQYVLTQQGVVSMSDTLTSTRVKEGEAKLVSRKIQLLISDLTAVYGTLFGWDLRYVARDNMLIVNVPSIVSNGNVQLVSNQITGAWSEFLNIDAACWGMFGSVPYFGDYSGNVHIFWLGNKDAVDVDGTGGRGIIASVMQAYSYIGDAATQKQVGMYRPTFIVNAPFAVNSAILYDFSTEDLSTPTAMLQDFGALWGAGLWNSSEWGGGASVQNQWIQAQGMGMVAALRMVVQTEAEVLWVSTDYSVVKGGGLF